MHAGTFWAFNSRLRDATLREQLISNRTQRPRMMLRKYSLFALFLVAPLAIAQTSTATPAASATAWETIAPEGDYVVTIPAGATYRLGDYTHNLWSTPVTVSVATTFRPLSYPSGQFPFADPDPGTVKELDVQELATPQTVTVVNQDTGVTSAQVVPPLVPPAVVPVAPGTSYTLTFSNFATSPNAGPNALMLALVNAPSSMANHTWEGTQMNLTIDGVTLTCTYGQTYTDGVFSLSCTVPPAVATPGTTGAAGQ
jgi:hypothetical protein